MAIQYRVTLKTNPRDAHDPGKYYATAKSRGTIDIRSLAEEISTISTVNPIDVIAVLEAFIRLIPEHLLDGYIIHLGDLGRFRLTVNSEGTVSKEEFTSRLIKKVKVRFLPGKLIKDKLKYPALKKIR